MAETLCQFSIELLTPSNLVLINFPIRKPVRSYWDIQDKEKFEIEYLQQIWNNISNMPGKPIHPIVLCSALKAVRLFSRGKCKNISCGARFSLGGRSFGIVSIRASFGWAGTATWSHFPRDFVILRSHLRNDRRLGFSLGDYDLKQFENRYF